MISKECFNYLLTTKQYKALESFKVENAVIMAAGLSSRFKPISELRPKSLCKFKGEVLIERQIKQLKEAGINEIYVIVGYKKEQFDYLKDLYHVHLVENKSYMERNNTGSLFLVKDILSNTYICSSDNYFSENPFSTYHYKGFYSAVFHKGKTKEWCLKTKNNIISEVSIGGKDSYVMMGHAYFDKAFSKTFVKLLCTHYNEQNVKNKVWEYLYINHLEELKLELKPYKKDKILEFDTVEEALCFDPQFIKHNLST